MEQVLLNGEFHVMGSLLKNSIVYIFQFILIFCILILIYAFVSSLINRRRTNILNDECDPEKYIEMLERLEEKSSKNERFLNILSINYAAGYMALGNYTKGKECLDKVDVKSLYKKGEDYLVYIINRIGCYYALGEMKEAEVLYETELVKLCPYAKQIRDSIQILIGERYYYLGNYEASYNHLKNLHIREFDKRQYLSVLYYLGKIELMRGEKETAVKRFEKVVKFGNQLGIAKQSREFLNQI